jgi:glutathione peroxidase-family protein
VLGFYSNDFGNQGGNPGTCNDKFKITFPTFTLDHVTGAQARPVFAWLAKQPNPNPPPALTPPPDWNFTKYLISKKGAVVKRWPSYVCPAPDMSGTQGDPSCKTTFDNNPVVIAIKAELAK